MSDQPDPILGPVAEDCFGYPLFRGDRVIFLKTVRTGSSSKDSRMQEGVIPMIPVVRTPSGLLRVQGRDGKIRPVRTLKVASLEVY